MKRSVIILLVLSMLPNVFALSQIAGALKFSIPVGGSDSERYGLINNGNQTVTVKLRAEGDAAQYLSFPGTVDIEPNKIVYTEIVASMPSTYKGASTLSGYMYAVQEGKPGQVQINVQMKKSVSISVQGITSSPSSPSGNSGSGGSTGTITNTNNNQPQQPSTIDQPSEQEPTDDNIIEQQAEKTEILESGLPVTGLAAALPADLAAGAAIAAIIIIILVAFAILKHFGKV